MKLKQYIVLPNGREFQIVTPDRNDYTKNDLTALISKYAKEIPNGDTLDVQVYNDLGQEVTLLLWGDVYKGSFMHFRLVD